MQKNNTVRFMLILGYFLIDHVYASSSVHVTVQERIPTYSAQALVESEQTTTLEASVTGRITEIAVKAGDYVAKGQLLFKVDERLALEQLAASQAQVQSAQAQMDLAEKERERATTLYKKGFLSRADYDNALTQYAVSRTKAEAQLATAKASSVNADYYTVTAPYEAAISSVNIEVGDVVSPGTQAISLYAPKTLRVTTMVPQSIFEDLDLTKLPHIEIPDLPHQSPRPIQMSVIPITDTTTQTVEIRVTFDLPQAKAQPGLFARVYFQQKTKPVREILIPQQSVIERDELRGVYLINKEGKTQFRQIHLGEPQGSLVQVLAGLDGNEHICLNTLQGAKGNCP